MPIFSTQRLVMDEMSVDDAAFIWQLFNDPLCLQFIGDKGLNSLEDARKYIIDGPQRSYVELGVGLWLLRDRHSKEPIGVCGLLKRPYLDFFDLGYGISASKRGMGYALEAAQGCLRYADELGITTLQAMVSPQNQASRQLLIKLGFKTDMVMSPHINPNDTLVFRYDH